MKPLQLRQKMSKSTETTGFPTPHISVTAFQMFRIEIFNLSTPKERHEPTISFSADTQLVKKKYDALFLLFD